MLHKKGIAISTLTYVMIALVGFFAISMVIGNFVMKSSDKEAEVLCRQSVNMRMTSSISDKIKWAPFYCKTLNKEVSGTKEEVMKEMADLMVGCWEMFGKGHYDRIFQAFNLLSFKNRCFHCYAAKVTDIEGEDDKITHGEFKYFLLNEKTEKGPVYYEYISRGGGPSIPVLVSTGETNEGVMFEEKGVYSVAYFDRTSQEKEEEEAGLLAKIGAGGAAASVGLVGIGIATGGVGLVVIGVVGAGAATYANIKSIQKSVIFDEPDKRSYAKIYVAPLNFLGEDCMAKSTD